ncbi:MAG: hypothetical protein JWO38_7526 [Gemmataceae bacterium]|nr:hypothetical protein [Gemmataceae bacterium]
MAGPLFDAPMAGEVLGAMITPAVLISASGTLTLSTSNRLARIVDRVRVLHTQAEDLPPLETSDVDTLEKRAHIADQFARQAQRIGILQAALITLYVAISFLVGSSLAIGLSAIMKGILGWVPVGLGLLGATALFAGAVLLIREARLAVRSSLGEMEYTKRMVTRRTGAPLPPPHTNGSSGPETNEAAGAEVPARPA